MTRDEFDEKYGKGSASRVESEIRGGSTLKEVGDLFDLSAPRISQLAKSWGIRRVTVIVKDTTS